MPGRDKRVKTGFLALVQAIWRASPAPGAALMCWRQADVDLNPNRVLSNWAIGGGCQSHNALEHNFLAHHPGPTPSSLCTVARVRDCVSTMSRPGPLCAPSIAAVTVLPMPSSQLPACVTDRVGSNSAVGYMGNYSSSALCCRDDSSPISQVCRRLGLGLPLA